MTSDAIGEEQKAHAVAWFAALRDDICARLEALEPSGARFTRKAWERGKNEGGGEMSLLSGEVFEKAGVHISVVHGEFSEEFRQQVRGAQDDPRFWAAGISVIAHPKNPHAPTAHMNTRMIATRQSWFGGGGDLTPMLEIQRGAGKTGTQSHEDTRDFHAALADACQPHDPDYYPRFKAACDEYFQLPHRGEPRGTGGIFYDHLDSGDWQADFAFAQDVGRAFASIYPDIITRRMNTPYSADERAEQLVQRGRYVEFNLLYDRGTTFGLKTGGNVESILSSLPPLVAFP